MKFEFPIHNSVFATKKRVIAFEFTAINKIDQGLMKMSAYMNSGKQDFEQPVKIPWYKSIAMKGKVTLKMRQFSSSAKSKAIYNDESVIFIVTDTSEDTCICDNAVRIVSYTNGELDDQDFKTPSPYQVMTLPLVAGPPGKPSVVNTTSNSIDLKWEKPQEYPEYTHRYKVLYCSRYDLPNSQWKSRLTNSVVEHITISELIPNKCYYFKVQALYHITASKESLVSDAISTKHAVFGPPGECRAEDVTHDSVTLYWSKPPNINPSKIERYKVLYRFDPDPHGDWKSKMTEDEKTNIKIHGLSPKTKYIFKVQAGSSDHHFGKESKESDVIMTESAICSPPGKPQVEVRDSSVAQLKWTKPLKYADTIQHYVVLYSSMDDETQQWQKYDQNNTTEEILVKGLSPDTRYCFKILAECKSGASEESETSNAVQTLVPIPSKPGQPVAVSITSKSINLIWAKPAQYPEYITNYCVSYRSQESKEWLSLHVDGEKETVTVTGLSPKTTYLFKVQAQSKTGSSETSEVSTAICILPPDPTQPGQPQALNISHDEITITWAKPQENAEYIQSYAIHYKSLQKSDTHGWTTAKTESMVEKLIVSGLEPNTSYIFKVQAESVDGPSKESETSNVIQTLVPIPSKPGQPEADSVTHDSVNLKWTKPTQYSEYVMNYHVSYYSQEQSKEWISLRVRGEKETVTVTGLSPKTTYLFKVQAQSKTGFSEMSEVSTGIHTLPPMPSQPGQPQAVHISHDKITITWAKPQENAEYIHNYTIHYKSLQKSNSHGWTTLKTNNAMEVLVVSGLEINTSYIFKVQAESVDGASEESETSNAVRTVVPIPSKPGQPVAVSVTSKSINLIWAKPAQYPEYITNYCVSYRSQESKEWLSLHVDGEKETVTVTGLSPKTTYLFKVQAQSKTESSETSEVSTAICILPPDPTQPGQPQALNISHDEITITWAKPQENAEYIQNYAIHYKSLQKSDTHGWTTAKTESTLQKLIVSGLEPNTSYIFKVQAESVDGPSKESETSNVIYTLVPIPSKPGQPKVVSVTHNSVNLKWTKPTQYSEYVMNYHVSYCSQEQSKEWISLRVQGEEETVAVTGLSPKTTYLFKVQAQSKTGFSEMSEVSTGIRTLPPVPSQPGQPQAVNISHNEITITWAKPQENAEYIHNYTIHYKSLQKSNSHGWTTVKTNNAMEELIVSRLEVNTRYIFKIQAEGVDGTSKESEISNMIHTLVPIPSKPGQPKAVSVTHNSVNLKWTKPTQYSEYVMNYHVSCCSQEQSKEWLVIHVRGEKETVTVTGLSPKTTYLFKVQAQSKTGFSEMSEVSTGIHTLPPVPSQPGQPQAVNTSYDKITITWAKPQENAEHVQNYIVYYTLPFKKSKWSTVKTKNAVEEIALSGLEVDTSYVFKVQAESADGLSKESEASDVIHTLVPIPSKPGQPEAVSVTHNSVSLKWTKPTQHAEYVMKYCVSYCSQEQSMESLLSVSKEVENVTVTGLFPKTTYLFKVHSQSKAGSSEMSEVSICTLSPVPSEPGQPRPVNISHDKITITWAKPHSHTKQIQSYTIYYTKTSDRQRWTKVKTQSAVEVLAVSGLETNTEYIFKVQAESADGPSKESETSNEIQTLIPIPSKPGQPKAVSVTHNSISLKWTKPTQYTEHITNYRVICFHQQSKEFHVDGEKETITVTGLSPKTTYLFKVQAQSKTGFSEMSEVSTGIHTLPPVPSQPGQPQAVTVTHDKIAITWAKPQENAEHVQNYIVYYTLPFKKSKWSTVKTKNAVEEIVLSGLEVDTSYVFKVQAESADGPSKESETSNEIQTLIPIPSKPGQPKVVSVTHNSISLKWTKPTQYTEYITNYHVICFHQQSKEFHVDGEKETITVTGLSPKTTYLFKVQAQSKTGFSKMSQVSTGIHTLPPVPSQPGQPKAVNTSHDKITITWAKPQENAEHVQNYIVYYTLPFKTSKWSTVKTKNAVEEIALSGLEVDTSYVFKVQAESADGPSKESETSNEIQTLIPIPSKPGQPKAVSVTHNSVTLKWAKPVQYAKYVLNYHVSYFLKNQCLTSLLVTGGQETITVTGLSPKTTYLFKVQAQSKAGSSDWSEVGIRTLNPVPSQPGQPQAVTITHDKITITWAKPGENAEYILNYIIYFASLSKKSQKPHFTEWSMVKTENALEVSVVSRLETNTEYIFKVQAESAGGCSEVSRDSNVIKTRSPVPSQPGKPTWRAKAHDCITLVWSKPTKYYENVERYEISYIDNKKEKTKVTDGRVEEIEIDGLDPQKRYYFKVKAKSKFGDSLNSLSSDLIGTNPVRPVLKIIPHCKKLQDSPTVYHLSMRKSYTVEKYAKFEYGKATDGTANKVLMIVGAIGSGKSTLINGMINYLLGVEWDDEFRLKLIHEEVTTQIKSVTKLISTYTFHNQDDFPLPYSLTIIDTPGFGDTEGIARDKEITSQIQEFFSLSSEQGIDHLDGIGFVTQGGLSRLTPTQRYIFDSIFSIFGKDMKDNIFTMVTFADGAVPPVIAAIEILCTEYFQFNNSALYAVKSDMFAKMFWDMGATSFNKFFDKFGKAQSVSLILTRAVLNQRQHLEAVIIGFHSQIQAGMLKINNRKVEQKRLQENEEKIKANENFMYEVEEDCMEKVKLEPGTYATICLGCNFTCHYPCLCCKGDNIYDCRAMKMPRNKATICTVCPGRCAWQQHRNADYHIEVKRMLVQKCYENGKKMYIEAKGRKAEVVNVITSMEQDIQIHFQIMLQNIMEAHRCIQCLDEIALKRHPLTDVGYIDLLIEAELRERKSGFEERVESYRVVREHAERIGKAKEMPQATPSIEETAKFWYHWYPMQPFHYQINQHPKYQK